MFSLFLPCRKYFFTQIHLCDYSKYLSMYPFSNISLQLRIDPNTLRLLMRGCSLKYKILSPVRTVSYCITNLKTRYLFLSVALKQDFFFIKLHFPKRYSWSFFSFFFLYLLWMKIFVSVSHRVIYRTSGLHNQLCFQLNIYIVLINV